MVLGAGETSELAARHLIRQGVTRLFVANRSPQRAAKLAQALQATAIPWEEFPAYLVQADIDVYLRPPVAVFPEAVAPGPL